MRKHLLLIVSIAVMLLTSVFSKAQTVYFTDGFENGLDAGWTQEYFDAVAGQWVTETPEISQPWKTESGAALQYPQTAAVGAGRAYFRQEAAEGKNVQTTGYRTRLITPKMDLSGYQPILRFYHAQAKWTADFDTLRVFYRQGTGTKWELLSEYTSPIQKWKFEEIDLPSTGNDYQIAFEANENMGRGIVLDSVIIRTKPQITTPHDMSYYDMRDNGINLTWEASKDADAFRVIVAEKDLDLNVYPTNVDSAQYIVVDTIIESDKPQDIRVNELASGRVYYMQVMSIGEFENSVWSETFSFRMKPVVNITAEQGYFEDFNIPYKSNLVKDMQLETWTWGGIDPIIPMWVGAENFYMYSPDASCAVVFTGENKSSSGELTYSVPAGEVQYVISPEISGKDIPNFSMSMCHVTFWGTTYKYQQNRAKAIIVGVATDPEDPTTFVPVDTCEVWGCKQFTFFDVDLSSYTGDGRYIAFVSNFQDNENWFALDKVTIELKPAVAAVTAKDVKVIPTTTEAIMSWPAVEGATSYKVKYMAMEDKGKTVPLYETRMAGATTVNTETNAIALTGLTKNTKFVYSIQAVGETLSAWSQPREFYTSAEMILPKLFEFEEIEGTYRREGEDATEIFHNDWYGFTNDADAPYLASSNYRTGSRCLYLMKDQYNEAWTVAPMVDDVKQVEMKFYARQSSTSYLGSNVIVGIMEDPTDLKTFTPIATCTPADVVYESFYVNFLNYTGTGKYIALLWGESGKSKNAVYIDDLTFRPIASCFVPTIDVQVTDSSAILHWTKMDESNTYTIKVSKKAIPENKIATTTGKDLLFEFTDYTLDSIVLDSLDFATTYYVYAQTVCSEADKSEWVENSFTTNCPEKMSLPYKTSFEKEATSTIPTCWIKPTWTTTTSTYPSVSTSYNHTEGGDKGLYMYSYTTYGSTIALPQLDANLEDVKLRFWAYYSSSDYKVFAGVMGDPNDPDDFYPVDTFKTVASQWILCEAMFTAEDLKHGQYLAISSFTGASNYVYIDDVEVINIVDAAPFNYKKVDAGTDWLEVKWDGKTTAQWDVIISKSCYAMPDSLADKVNPGDSIPVEDILVNTQTATNSYKIESGLESLTWYYVYAKSTAGKEWSMDSIQTECTTWNPRVKMVQGFEADAQGNPIRSTTSTMSTTTTYVNYFKNAKVPECWTVGNAKYGTDVSQRNSSGYIPYICTDGTAANANPTTTYAEKAATTYQYSTDGVNSLKVYSYYSSTASSNQAPAWAAMNKLECSNEDLKSLILTFDYQMATTAAYGLVVGIMDDPTDLSTFYVLDSIPGSKGTGIGSHKHASVEIALDQYEGTGRYIAFRGRYGATTIFYLDNVSVNLATCPNPNPSMSQITDNSAVLASGLRVDNGWKYIVTDLMYQASVLDGGTMPDAEHIVAQANVLPQEEGDPAPKMTRIEGLQGNTTYYAYVTTLCEGDEISAWKMVSFTTLCDPVDADTWVGNFENDATSTNGTDSRPECWTVGSLTAGATGTYIPYVVSTNRAEIMEDPAAGKIYNKDSVVTGAKVLRLYAYGTATSVTSAGSYAISQAIKPAEGKSFQDYQIMFKGFGTGGPTSYTTSASNKHNLRVGMTSDPSDLSKVTILDTVSLPTNTQQCIVELSNYQGDGKYIVFLLEKEDVNYSYAFIYDIHLELIPACKVPRGIVIDSIGDTFVSASWKGGVSLYNVAISKKLYTDDQKAGYLANDSVIAADGIVFKAATENAITFDGLEPNSVYYLYVQGKCSDTESSLWSYESPMFHTECPAEMPIPYKENFEKYATSSLAVDCWDLVNYATGTGYPKILKPSTGAQSGNMLELYSTSTTQRNLALMPKVVGNLKDYVFSMDARSYGTTTKTVLYVGTMGDVTDTTTFVPFDTIYMDGGNEFTHVEYVLADYNVVYDRIAITSGIAKTMEMTTSDTYIDNIRLGLPISCFPPQNVEVSKIGLSTAELTFTPADSVSNEWEIELTKAGGEPQKFTTNQPSYQFTDLDQASMYSVIVRTVCDGDYSDYTDAVTFNTQWEIDTYKWTFTQNEQGTVSVPHKKGAAVATYALHPALISTGSQATLDYSSNTTYLPYQIMNTTSLAYDADKRDFVNGGDTARALRLYRYFSTSYAYGDSAAVIMPYIVNPQGKQLSMDLRFGWAYASNHSTATLQDVVSSTYPKGILCIGTVDSMETNLNTYKEITRVYPHPLTASDTLHEASHYGWMHYVLPLDMNLAGKQLVLMAQSPVSSYICIDNLAVEAAEGLTTPVITSVRAGDTYATVNWTGNASAYNIYVVDTTKWDSKDKHIPYIQDAPVCVDTILNVTGNSYKVTGLASGGQTYAFYVEDAAKVGVAGALSNRAFATTVCPAIQVNGEYSYDFEPGPNYKKGTNPSTSTADGFTFQWPTSTTVGDTVYKTPECWTIGMDYNGYDPSSAKSYNPTMYSNTSSYIYSRNGYSSMRFNGTSTYKNGYAVMPLLSGFDMDTMEVNFWGRCTYETAKGVISTVSYLKGTSYSTKLIVGTMTDPTDPSTFVALDTIEYDYTANDMNTSTSASSDENNFWLNFAVPLKGATGPYIAFKQVDYGYFYMDDLKLQKRQTARRPRNLEVVELGSTSATVKWNGIEEGASYEVQISTSRTNWVSAQTFTTDKDSFTFENLEVATEYFFRVKQKGTPFGDTEYAHYESFRTECLALNPNGYKTGFECNSSDQWQVVPGATGTNVNTMKQNLCWTYWNIGTTQTVSSTYFPYNIAPTTSASYAHSGNMALKLNAYSTTYQMCVVSPLIEAELGEAGKGFDTLQVSFWACPSPHGLSGTNKDKISSASNNTYGKYIEIGTCTDPTDTATYTVLQGWTYEVEGDNLKTGVQADASNDYAFRKVTVKLNNATGPYVFIRANKVRELGDGKSFSYSTMYIDDLQFEKLLNCPVPTDLKAEEVTVRNAKVQWSGEAMTYDLQVSEDPTFTDEAKALVDTTELDVTSFFVESLQPNIQYYYRLKSYCDEAKKDASDWTMTANFRTPYAPLYTEDFTMSLGEWKMGTGYANKVFSGEIAMKDTTTSGTYNSWYRVQNLALSGYAVRMLLGYAASTNPTYPISSTYQGESYLQKYWLVSPSITIEKENAQLAFEAALTNYTTANPIYAHGHWNEGWDDQFMVIISEDDGKTWKRENATIWNNEKGTQPGDSLYKYGQGDYVLTDIPATPTQLSVDLNKYTGKTIRIAFYGENTYQNAMNAIHVDKIHVNYLTKFEENLELCQFEDIDDVLGFSINGDTVPAGEMNLKRSVLSYVEGVNDSLFVLDVNYKEAPQYYYEITICEGQPFEYMGFNQHTAPGTYRMKLTSQATGCDSIVNFTIKHTKAFETTFDASICQGDTYEFNGKYYSEAGTYVDTLSACDLYGACDSIVTLNLSVRSTNRIVQTATILHGESYDWYGQELKETVTIDTVFTNQAGCDSIMVLNLTVKYADPVPFYDTICQGDTYSWAGQTYQVAGIYYDTIVVAGKADSIAELNLAIKKPSAYTINANILHGEIYNWFDEQLTETTTRDTVLVNAVGCDSLLTLNLVVKYAEPVDLYDAFCQGTSYEWLGKVYDVPGTYLDTVPGQGVADQVLRMNLSYKYPSDYTINKTILHGESYDWFGELLTESAVRDTVLENAVGCDSMLTLNLTVKYADVEYVEHAICEGDVYTWLDKEYSQVGTYLDTVREEGQADKIYALVLSVNKPSYTVVPASILHGEIYEWAGQQLTESGIYVDSLQNQYGCDSVVTLNLAVSYAAVIDTAAAICEGDTYIFNDKVYSKAGTYADTVRVTGKADVLYSLTLTVNKPSFNQIGARIFHGQIYDFNGKPLTKPGSYLDTLTNIYGCDSIVQLFLTVTYAPTIDTTASICEGDVYVSLTGKEFTKVGTYMDTVRVEGQADQIYRIVLTVNSPSAYEYAAKICEGDAYDFNGKYLSETGVYVDTLVNIHGCDSIVTLRLTVNQPQNEEYEVTICHGTTYVFGGDTLSVAGVYTDTIKDGNGCDAVVTLTLNIAEPLTGTHYAEFCGEAYYYQGKPYTAGTHEVWVTNEHGCDSIVTLILTQTFDVHDTLNITLCAGETYSDENFTVNEPGTYYAETTQLSGCVFYHVLYFDNYPTEMIVDTTVLYEDLVTLELAIPEEYKPYAEELIESITESGDYTDSIAVTSPQGCDNFTLIITLHVKDAMAIQNIYEENGQKVLKVLYQDHIYIIRQDGWYNVSGQKIAAPIQ